MAPSAKAKAATTANMAPPLSPSTLDLLFLTFNCAKNIVNVGVFATHLQDALGQNATGLPDVVVLSLQEFAPMSYSFIGGSLLNQYITPFEEAINLAALRHDEERSSTVSITPTEGESESPQHYSLVKAKNVGYTAMLLFAKHPSRLRDIQEAEVGFGAAEMGNKGAVGLRALYDDGHDGHTELTFVATHLAAMEWNLAKRNANWAAIMRGLTFENPEEVLERCRLNGAAADGDGGGGEASERTRLLRDGSDEQDEMLQQKLHEISVFKPSSWLFVGGDLNYRISTKSPTPGAPFPSLDPASEDYYPTFFPLDQLTRERKAGRTLHGMSEAEVNFPPTYKYDVLPPKSGQQQKPGEMELDVPWKFAPHRYPSWTDRVLYLDVPAWLREKVPEGVRVKAYNALPLMRSSDHRPVFLRADVPLISPEDMRTINPGFVTPERSASATPETASNSNSSGSPSSAVVDPRLRLPVEIDPEAWDRRMAARRKEVMAGWSMFLWSTKPGAYILATLVVASVGAYWVFRTT